MLCWFLCSLVAGSYAFEVHLYPFDVVRSRPHSRLSCFALARRDLLKSAAMSCISLQSVAASRAGKGGGTIGWGIVGLGDVCAVKAGPAFIKADGSTLVAVMRRTPGAAEQWVQENVPGSGCTGYSDIDAFLADPALDAVRVCVCVCLPIFWIVF